MSNNWYKLKASIQPPKLRMKDILPEMKKEAGLSANNRSVDSFLDSEWWYSYHLAGRKVLTDEYLKKHYNWWLRVKNLVEGQIENTSTLCTIEFEVDGYKNRIYFEKPPY